MSTVTFQDNPVSLKGQFPQVGAIAPSFELCATDLSDIRSEDFADKTLLMNIFPSIDTPVCSASVRAFNEKAANIDNVVVLCISADLPFATKRFCETEGIDGVKTASFFRSPGFAEAYGVNIHEGPLRGLAARAVVIIKDAKVSYAELVSEITHEPNYDKALSALS
jgi:thiol peroxidase